MESRRALLESLGKAHALHQAGRHAAAEAAYRGLLRSAPNEALLHNLLGLLYLQTGRAEEAAKQIRTALKLRPSDPQAQYNLALALIESEALDEAQLELERLISLQPENVEALNALGNVERLRGNASGALTRLQQARQMAPDHPGVLLNLGLAFMAAGMVEDAVRCLEESSNLAPTANLHSHLGAALNATGDTERAIGAFKSALRLDPELRDAWINLGITLEQIGDLESAERVFRDAVKTLPNFGSAYYHLMQLSAANASDDDILGMRSALADERTQDADRILLHYGLGRAHEKHGDYAGAFGAFRDAHALKSAAARFDLDAHSRRISLLMREFAEIQPLSIDRPDLVFVVGMPRSGTTLAEQILASHSQVSPLGEQPIIGRLAGKIAAFTGKPFPQGLSGVGTGELLLWARECRDEYPEMVPGRVVTDTTPSNYLLVGLIARVFPSARIVHCMRHPMDTCLSIYQYPLSGAHAYAHDLTTLGAVYKAYRRLVAHWRTLLGTRLHDLRYERLVANSRSEIHDLLAFCGLEFEAGCLEFHRSNRRVRTPSASQVRQPLHQASVGRWKNYAPYLESLMAAIGAFED